MKILPAQTQPPQSPTARRHEPRPAGRWSAYRECLRWDFGFTCAFCLLHEADLFGGAGGEGLSGTTAEHRLTRRDHPSKANAYGNILYACRFCNRKRSSIPIQKNGRQLLDPTETAWSDHFVVAEDELQPRAQDADASYTHEAYDLNDPRKVARRRSRRLLIADRMLLLEHFGEEVVELLRLADQLRTSNLQQFAAVLQAIKRLRGLAVTALSDLARYAAVPVDAPTACRCASKEHHALPPEFDKQLIDIPIIGIP